MTYATFDQNSYHTSGALENNKFYAKVMTWVALSFLSATIGAMFIGPMVPTALMMPLYFVAFIALLVAGFSRKAMGLAPVFAIAVPLILGIILYPTLNYYLSNGMGDIVGISAGGTAVIFGAMAVIGWVSKINLNRWASKLFFILLGLIALSFLNIIFQLPILTLVISATVIVVMSLYTFIDTQRLRDRTAGDTTPAAFYALNLFLNIYNIFVSLLNILGIVRN